MLILVEDPASTQHTEIRGFVLNGSSLKEVAAMVCQYFDCCCGLCLKLCVCGCLQWSRKSEVKAASLGMLTLAGMTFTFTLACRTLDTHLVVASIVFWGSVLSRNVPFDLFSTMADSQFADKLPNCSKQGSLMLTSTGHHRQKSDSLGVFPIKVNKPSRIHVISFTV